MFMMLHVHSQLDTGCMCIVILTQVARSSPVLAVPSVDLHQTLSYGDCPPFQWRLDASEFRCRLDRSRRPTCDRNTAGTRF